MYIFKHSLFRVARLARVQAFVCVGSVVRGAGVLSCAGVVLCWCLVAEEETHGPTRGRKRGTTRAVWTLTANNSKRTGKRKFRKFLSLFSSLSLSLFASLLLSSHCVKHCLIKTASNFEAFECDLHSICQRIARNAVTHVTVPPPSSPSPPLPKKKENEICNYKKCLAREFFQHGYNQFEKLDPHQITKITD